jgi:protein-S-isoprenylcysteine O-methyltransferase Ste14
MIFKDSHDPSYMQKSLFCCCLILALVASLWHTFYRDPQFWFNGHTPDSYAIRSIIMALCLVVYVIRVQATVWVFSRRTWTWLETEVISIVMVIALYGYGRVAAMGSPSVGWFEAVGVLFFLIGSYLNTRSEYDRHRWKKMAQNRGRLYTEGLFSYSMHINYFGDIMLFSGLAMVAGRLVMFVIPLVMTLNFIFVIIPLHNRYLKRKYGAQYLEYSKKTRKLVPWVL